MRRRSRRKEDEQRILKLLLDVAKGKWMIGSLVR